jgi:hypothetical protein
MDGAGNARKVSVHTLGCSLLPQGLPVQPQQMGKLLWTSKWSCPPPACSAVIALQVFQPLQQEHQHA